VSLAAAARAAIRDQRRAAEANATREALAKRLLERRIFPSKRFRVDGSRAGNSQLLKADDAALSRGRYGGTIVEIITLAQFLTEKATGLPPCREATCSADADRPCHDGKGYVIKPHKNRLRGGTGAGYDACQTCGAHKHDACKTPKGKARKPHKDRPFIEMPTPTVQPGGAP